MRKNPERSTSGQPRPSCTTHAKVLFRALANRIFRNHRKYVFLKKCVCCSYRPHRYRYGYESAKNVPFAVAYFWLRRSKIAKKLRTFELMGMHGFLTHRQSPAPEKVHSRQNRFIHPQVLRKYLNDSFLHPHFVVPRPPGHRSRRFRFFARARWQHRRGRAIQRLGDRLVFHAGALCV